MVGNEEAIAAVAQRLFVTPNPAGSVAEALAVEPTPAATLFVGDQTLPDAQHMRDVETRRPGLQAEVDQMKKDIAALLSQKTDLSKKYQQMAVENAELKSQIRGKGKATQPHDEDDSASSGSTGGRTSSGRIIHVPVRLNPTEMEHMGPPPPPRLSRSGSGSKQPTNARGGMEVAPVASGRAKSAPPLIEFPQTLATAGHSEPVGDEGTQPTQTQNTAAPMISNEHMELLRALAAQVAQLQQQVKDGIGARPTRAGMEERPGPFTQRITQDAQGADAKPLKIACYDGKGDPYLYLDTFRTAIAGKGYGDSLKCHAFQSTLKDEAMSWFFNMKPNSVNSFQTLADQFIDRFILMSEGRGTCDHLLQYEQGDSETLKSYISRFLVATSKCRELDEKIAYSAFMNGLQATQFKYKLNSKLPSTFTKLIEYAMVHAQAELATYGGPQPIEVKRRKASLTGPDTPQKPKAGGWSKHNGNKRDREDNRDGRNDRQSKPWQRDNQTGGSDNREAKPMTRPDPRYRVHTVMNEPIDKIFEDNTNLFTNHLKPREYKESSRTRRNSANFTR